jgi:hypothetical protein
MTISTRQNTSKKALGLTAGYETGETPLWETGEMAACETLLTAISVTQVTGIKQTRRGYKPRARHCKTCDKVFTPKSKHGKFCSDTCRKKDWRERQGRAKQNKPEPVKEVLLELGTCPCCNKGFIAQFGKGQRYCTPSCKTKAWRLRREAAIEALMFDMGISATKAADVIETGGMKKITQYLLSRGYTYDTHERTWLMPLLIHTIG